MMPSPNSGSRLHLLAVFGRALASPAFPLYPLPFLRQNFRSSYCRQSDRAGRENVSGQSGAVGDRWRCSGAAAGRVQSLPERDRAGSGCSFVHKTKQSQVGLAAAERARPKLLRNSSQAGNLASNSSGISRFE